MKNRRQEDWDDWDDDKPTTPEDPGMITTPRILIGLVVVIVAALVIGGIVGRSDYQFEEVPEPLIGMWTCEDPERSDLWVEFKRNLITFGTGGTGDVTHRVVGVDHDQVGEINRYQIVYRDLAGRQHMREVLLSASGDSLRFADDANTTWMFYGD